MNYRAFPSRLTRRAVAALALLCLAAPSALAAELSAEIRPTDPVLHPGKPALLSVVLNGVEAGKLYTLLPPAEANAPAITWGTLEWNGLASAPAAPGAVPELQLNFTVTAAETGSVELPSLQVRAVHVAESTALIGEAVDLSTAVVVPTKPLNLVVKTDLRPYLNGGAVAAGVLLVLLLGIVAYRKLRPAPQQDVDASLSPAEQAREHVHAARRHRLDGDFYQFYLSLSRAAKALNLEGGSVATRLEARAQEVGYKGVRPTEDEMDGILKDIERALTQRNKDS